MNSTVISKVASSGSTLILDTSIFYKVREGQEDIYYVANSIGTRIEDRFVPREVGARDDISISRWPDLPPPRQSKTIFIRDLGDPRVAPIRALPASIEFGPDLVSAFSYDIEEFGIGADEFEAVEDLKASIAALYFLLKDDQTNLGPLPQRQWAFLKGVMREI